eukprot:TRINITY_DN33055_c0_g1_i1.p1 TRINITY_DN33055_c0_g1~~TRINITY_DN33055_c0_g1_i1.p1  ORF type:complete len:277 (-),score=78.08 TRINITY_DN33055_c0_g1_i1:77-907(-)
MCIRDRSSKVAVILHGIMGSGRNWRTPAKKLTVQHPGWSVLCLDHLGHGTSPAAPEATLQTCVDHVEDTLAAVGCSPEVVIGHSFGGKVALALTHSRRAAQTAVPKATWIIDSVPGAMPESALKPTDNTEVPFVIAALSRVSTRAIWWKNRQALEADLKAEGVSVPVAQWLATSTRSCKERGATALELVYDVPTIVQLFGQYRKTDYWDVVQSAQAESTIGMVCASKNAVWGESGVAAQVKKMPPSNPVVTLEAGHNVHVDNLPGLLEALAPSFRV